MKRRASRGLAGAAALATCLAAGTPSTVAASVVCDALGSATQFALVASKRLVTKERAMTYYAVFGVAIDGAICVGRARLQAANLYAMDPAWPANVVATATRGGAVRFVRIRGLDYPYPEPGVEGDVVTGGGRVRGSPGYLDGVIDTSGTRPELAACASAIADAESASDTLAALPPDLDLGRVAVRLGGERIIDAGSSSVIHMDSLRLQGARIPHAYGYTNLACDNVEDVAYFVLLSSASDPVVLNVDRLSIGNCALLELPSDIVINVPGRGRRVKIGVGVDLYDLGPAHILAPGRSLAVEGTGTDDATYMGRIWAKNLRIKGYTEIISDLGWDGLCESP